MTGKVKTMISSPTEKKVSELTFDDFVTYPIWTWADEDTDMAIPLGNLKTLPEDHNALFVACEFLLCDGTKVAGVLSIRMSDHIVYLLSFPGANSGVFDFPLQPQLKDTVSRDQLATWLQRPLECIFPITYSTPYKFSDGQPLIGQIE